MGCAVGLVGLLSLSVLLCGGNEPPPGGLGVGVDVGALESPQGYRAPSEAEIREVVERPVGLDLPLGGGAERVRREVDGGLAPVVGKPAAKPVVGPVGKTGDTVGDGRGVLTASEMLAKAGAAMDGVGTGRFRGVMKEWFPGDEGSVEVVVGVAGLFAGAESRAYRFLSGDFGRVGGWHVLRMGDVLYMLDVTGGVDGDASGDASGDVSGDNAWVSERVDGDAAAGWLFLQGADLGEDDLESVSVQTLRVGGSRFFLVKGVLVRPGMGDVVGMGGGTPEGLDWRFTYLLREDDFLVMAGSAALVGEGGPVSLVELEFYGYGDPVTVRPPAGGVMSR